MPGLEINANTTTLAHGIVAIDTEYVRPLQDASHLVIESGRAAFVDTGVNSSVPLLVDALRQNDLDAGDVDYVFLTHVHLDHAGGAGSLMKELPNARCVIHPRGAPHMIDPEKLIRGTEAVYGIDKTREIYGDIVPIAHERIDVAEDGDRFSLGDRPLTIIHTEGHARHHYCLHDPTSQGVFTGDSFGVSYRELDTAAGEFIFPTTTPVQFDPVAAHAAVDRILGLEATQAYLTHYSRVGDLERLANDMHECIDAFVRIAETAADASEPYATIRDGLFDYLADRLVRHGYDGDRDAMRSVLYNDMELNAQGLVVWLSRK